MAETSKALQSVAEDMVYSVSTLNCGILVRDGGGFIHYVNDRLQQWLGYTEDELVGEPVTKLIVPELEKHTREELEKAARGDARARLSIFQRKDSTTIPVLIVPQIRKPGDEEMLYVCIIIDLGTVQTAKSTASTADSALRGRLERIALELQSIGLTAGISGSPSVSVDHPKLDSLSEREREVVAHLVAGERVAAIAKVLHISPHTVRNHLKSVYRQLGVGSQSELIEFVKELQPADD